VCRTGAEIRRLHAAVKVSISEIARRVGVTRLTVRRALASTGPPKYERAPTGSATDAFEEAIRTILKDHPRMPATVLAERVGWDRGLTVFKKRVAELRPMYLPPDPASRTTYLPGEIAQFDFWFPPISVDVGHGQAVPRQASWHPG
jgi:transposase